MKHVRKNRRLLALFAIFIALSIVFFYKITRSEAPTISTFIPATKAPIRETDQIIFAATADNQNLYINKKYGFSFIYPAGWRTGDYDDDFLDLYNFPEKDSMYHSSIFAKGENKIVMSIGDTKSTDNEWIDGDRLKFIAISIPDNPNLSVRFNLYGDTNNLDIANQIFSSISWIK